MKRDLALMALFTYLLVTCGCAVAVIGIGAAAGVGAAYVAGQETRIYDADYDQAVQACKEALNALKMPVSRAEAAQSRRRFWPGGRMAPPIHIEVTNDGPGRSAVLAAISPEARDELKGALYDEARKIAADARFNLTPKGKTGILRDSIGVHEPTVTQAEISVAIYAGGGDAAPYALAVHEHPSEYDPPLWRGKTIKWTVPGTGPKYLQKPVHAAAKDLDQRLAKRLDLRKAARG